MSFYGICRMVSLQYHLQSECPPLLCTDVEFNVITIDSAVRHVQWQEGSDYIYVATDTSVSSHDVYHAVSVVSQLVTHYESFLLPILTGVSSPP